MAYKLQLIKETFEKLKTHSYEIQFLDRINEDFICQFIVNNVLVSTGIGRNKQSAKIDAGNKGYEELMKYDHDFSYAQGVRIKNQDYQQLLQQFAQDNGYDKVVFREIYSSYSYFHYECRCGEITEQGLGISVLKARNNAAFNLLESIKQNNSQVIAPQIKQETDRNESQQSIDNFQAGFILSRDLIISNENYEFFFKFIKLLQNGFVQIVPMGGYCTQSLRATKPDLDVIVYIDEENIEKYLAHLQEIRSKIQFQISKRQNTIQVLFQEKVIMNKKLKIKCPEFLSANLYLTNFNQQLYFEHYKTLSQYTSVFQQQLYASYSLILIHQWREDSNQIYSLPIELLDYLVIQVTNEFKSLNSPYQVLGQIIYLLKNGILKEIQNHPSIELNPFLQSLPQVYKELAQSLGDKVEKIKIKSLEWNQQKLAQWLLTFQ